MLYFATICFFNFKWEQKKKKTVQYIFFYLSLDKWVKKKKKKFIIK